MKKNFPGGCTYTSKYAYILEKKLCSVVIAYLIPRENNSDLTSGRFHDGTEMHMCLRVRLNVTWIWRNCLHIHPLTGQRRLKQLGPTRTILAWILGLHLYLRVWPSSIETYCFRLDNSVKNFGKNMQKTTQRGSWRSDGGDDQLNLDLWITWWNLSWIQWGRRHPKLLLQRTPRGGTTKWTTSLISKGLVAWEVGKSPVEGMYVLVWKRPEATSYHLLREAARKIFLIFSCYKQIF